MAKNEDERGLVAVVCNSCFGPAVHFLRGHRLFESRTYQARLVDAMRTALFVYAEGRGDGFGPSSPQQIWVQARAGKWERA